MCDCFQLLHFHQGSQITNIRHIKAALNESARVYVELVKRGAGLKFLDVGGGLGVDYDGSQTDFESSVNYTVFKSTRTMLSAHVQNVCDDAGVEHPTIMSESGRAVVAYHSMLVFSVLGVSEQAGHEAHRSLLIHRRMWSSLFRICLRLFRRVLMSRNLLESYHDAQQSLSILQ